MIMCIVFSYCVCLMIINRISASFAIVGETSFRTCACIFLTVQGGIVVWVLCVIVTGLLACQQRVPKTFLGPDYHRSENDIVLLRYFLENLGIFSSQFYLATSQFHYLIVIRMDSSLSTLCHSRGVPCQQRVLKRCPDPGYLRSRIVWLWHCMVNLFVYI